MGVRGEATHAAGARLIESVNLAVFAPMPSAGVSATTPR